MTPSCKLSAVSVQRSAEGGLRIYIYPHPSALIPLGFIDYPSAKADPRDGRLWAMPDVALSPCRGGALHQALLAAIMDSGGTRSDLLDNQIATEIYKVAHRSDLDPDEVFVAGLRLLQSIARSNFKYLLAPLLADWLHARWTYALKEQRFSIRNPASSTGPIEKVLAESDRGLAFICRLALATQYAAKTRISQSFREYLQSLLASLAAKAQEIPEPPTAPTEQ